MRIQIDVELVYDLKSPTDLLLQIEADGGPGQQVETSRIDVLDPIHFARVPAQDGVGDRIWVRAENRLDCRYSTQILVSRPRVDLTDRPSVPPHQLPGETVRYLLPSRYCPSDEFQNYVSSEFGSSEGGARITEIRNWIAEKVAYASGSSGGKTTALDTFVQRRGVCRDFAHLMITMARASTIPARFVSVYAPGVSPPDFHAVAEVFLDGGWYLVDPTGMADADSIAIIGVGSDAAEVAFLTGYGAMTLVRQEVVVSSVHEQRGV